MLVTQLHPTLCNPWTIYTLSGSSVHGILQARILKWVAISFFRRSSQPRDRTQVSYTAGSFLHCRQILYQLSHQETLRDVFNQINEWNFQIPFKIFNHSPIPSILEKMENIVPILAFNQLKSQHGCFCLTPSHPPQQKHLILEDRQIPGLGQVLPKIVARHYHIFSCSALIYFSSLNWIIYDRFLENSEKNGRITLNDRVHWWGSGE